MFPDVPAGHRTTGRRAVLVGAGFLVMATATRLLVSRGAPRAGQQARSRAVSRTGKDLAANAVNRAVNGWAAEHPVGVKVLVAAILALGVMVGVLRRAS